MPTAGNIEAIRDWVNRYYYKKSDVNKYFTRLNEGLTAYALTLVGPANTTCTIAEQVQSNPQTYYVDLPSSGVYTGIFFFTTGSTIVLSAGQYLETYTLSAYQDTIIFSNLFPLVRIVDKFSNTANDKTTSLSVSGCSPYDSIIVFATISARDGVPKASMEPNTVINEGTKICDFGAYVNSSSSSQLITVYQIPVTADTMTLTGQFYYYQVLGLRPNRTFTPIVNLWNNTSNNPTSIPVGDCSNYIAIVPVVSRTWRSGITRASMEPQVYYSTNTPISESGFYLSSANSSILTRTYTEILTGDSSDVTLTNLQCSTYAVFGIA